MKSSRLFHFTASLACAVLLVSCSSTGEQPADDRFVVIPEDESFELVFPKVKDGVLQTKQDLVPGKIYLGCDIDGVFTLKEVRSLINEEGKLETCVMGATLPYSFWTWLWHGEKERRIAYRFLWFDKDGKLVANLLNSVPGTRITMPGDPVRFSGLAREENVTQFSIVLNLLDENEMESIQEAQAIKGAALDKIDPAKEEPLKEVKIEK